MTPPEYSFDVAKFVAGTAGAIASLKFVNGTIPEKSFMVLGGSSLSYYGATPLAIWSGMNHSEGLVGFLLGLFGMAIVAKTYEVVQLLDTKLISMAVVDGIRRLFGLTPKFQDSIRPSLESSPFKKDTMSKEKSDPKAGDRRVFPDR
jgi:hypothetical protein